MCHVWCEASQPFNEVIVIPEVLVYIPFFSEREVNYFVNAKRRDLLQKQVTLEKCRVRLVSVEPSISKAT